MEDPKELFDRWYVRPLAKLEEMPRGDGAFVALAVSCALYERYATAKIMHAGGKGTKQAKLRQFMTDFGTPLRTAEVFWEVIRDGLAHQAMPLQDRKGRSHPGWWFHHSFPDTTPVRLDTVNGVEVLKVQPWHFMKRVFGLWHANMALLAHSQTFPWGRIIEK